MYKLFLFDINLFTKLKLSGTPSATLISNHTNGGVLVTGVTSGATGIVFADGTANEFVNLQNITGAFSTGEKIKVSDSAETDSIVESSGNVDLTILEITTQTFSGARSVFMEDADSGQDFTADFVLEVAAGEEGSILLDGTDANGADAGSDVLEESELGVEAIGREANGLSLIHI